VHVESYARCVNRLRQTNAIRHIVTSQIAFVQLYWPP